MRRLLLVVGLLLLTAAPARAEDAAQVAAALHVSPVYQAPGLDLVDVASLTSELQDTDPQLYVAVLPASAGSTQTSAKDLAIEIGKALKESDDVVLVIAANGKFGTGHGDVAKARGVDSAAALTEELKSLHSLKKDALTAFVLSFSQRIAGQVATPQPGVRSDGPIVETGGGSGTGWLVGGTVVILLGLATAAVVVPRRLRGMQDT
jgi:hypothetical protein